MRLEASQLSVDLGGRRVLHAASVALRDGEVMAVLGPNGAGKSTLLKALAGLLPPADGTVRFEGRDLAAIGPRELGRHIAYVPQDRIAHWPIRVRAAVALGRLPHGGHPDVARAADVSAVEHALAAMDVADLADRPLTELSGGERARVLLARALAQEAPVLIADEPLAGLDPAHQMALAGEFTKLAAAGRSVVVAVHDLTLALRIASRVVVLGEGQVQAEGAPGVCLVPELIARVFGIRARIERIDGVPVVVPLALVH